MGLFSYFRDRRERESQLHQLREAGVETEALPAALDAENLRRNPDAGIRNPLRSGSGSAPPADLGEVVGLIQAALAQGNVTVSAEGKVIDLRGTGLHGQAFEPIELTGEEPGPPGR